MKTLKIDVNEIRWGSVDSAIKELQEAKASLLAQGADPESIELDIELEQVPYEDRETVACYVIGRK